MDTPDDPKQGVTGVASARESDQWAQEQSRKLQAFLHDSGFFESEESAQTRERVLGRLDYMVKGFVAGLPGAPEKPGGKIFTFGSYRLGVHDRGADIDALCVVPRHVARRDFFSAFYEQLRSDPGVQELTKVEDSYVPLIKMKFHGIPIDATFARLGVPVIRDNINLLNDTILRAMDEKCIVSLNGSRVTDAILSLVPAPEVFHGALRAVKLWAKRRFIYGATYGYFGGVAFAICVARVCQMYPAACPYDILLHFFEQFSAWKWPAPVLLRPVVDLNYHLKVWDPRVHPADRYHRMPVITPAYPSMCSTHNVTQSTAAHITAELVRGCEIARSGSFEALFEPADFAKKHKLFLEVSVSAPDTSDFLAWSGFVESKLRTLTAKLEAVENITTALIFPKCFRKAPAGAPEAQAATAHSTSDVACAAPGLRDADNTANNKLGSSTDTTHRIVDNCSTAVRLESTPTDTGCPRAAAVGGAEDESAGGLAGGCLPGLAMRDVDEAAAKDENASNYPGASTAPTAPGKRKHDGDAEEPKVLKVEDGAGPRIADDGEPHTALWFIALSVLLTKNTGKKLYIDEPIRDFLAFVNAWEQKTGGMDIKIHPRKKKEVQNFIAEAPGEGGQAQ